MHELPTKLGALRGSMIMLAGDSGPGLYDDIDAGRLGRDTVPVPEWGAVVAQRTVNWGIVPSPTRGWAGLVHPDLDGDAALERLWSQIEHVCRLDEPDPGAAGRARAPDRGGVHEPRPCADRGFVRSTNVEVLAQDGTWRLP